MDRDERQRALLHGHAMSLKAALDGASLETALDVLVRTAVECFGRNTRAAGHHGRRAKGAALVAMVLDGGVVRLLRLLELSDSIGNRQGRRHIGHLLAAAAGCDRG